MLTIKATRGGKQETFDVLNVEVARKTKEYLERYGYSNVRWENTGIDIKEVRKSVNSEIKWGKFRI